jgi:hypothetical protein
LKLFLDNPHLFEYFGLVVILLLLFGATFFFKNLVVVRKWSGLGLIIVPIVYFYLLLDAYVLNIPLTDDFNLLETIYDLQHAPDFLSAVKSLFEQVNQHRFAFERIVMLLMVFFTGTVNIKLQIFLGNFFLLGILYLLFLSFKKENISWYYFIPVPYILFNLIFFENAYWGIAALQNTPLIFFAFLSAYGLAKGDQKGWYLGLVAALLTTFTSGSGLLTLIIGVVILLFQKRFRLLLWWVIAMVAIILFYFLFDYQFVSSPGEKVWVHPIFNLVSIFGFWGNALYLDVRHPLVSSFHRDLIWCVMLGAGMGVLFVGWLFRIWFKKKLVWSDWFLWGALMFAMGTGVMFVISRPINNYLMYGGTVFSRRYMTFGIALLATVYVCLVVLLKDFGSLKKIVAGIAMLAFLSLNVLSYYLSIFQIRKLHDELAIDGYYWNNYKTFLTVGDKFSDIPFWNHPTRMRDLIKNLESTGLSDFYQNYSIPDHQKLIEETGKPDQPFKGEFDAKFQYRNGESNLPAKYFKFHVTPDDENFTPSYFVLASKKYTIVLPAVPAANSPQDFLKKATYYSNNYQYSLYKIKLPAGTYDAWIMSRDPQQPGKWQSQPTGKQVLFY